MRKIFSSDSALDHFLETHYKLEDFPSNLHLPAQIDSLEMQLKKAEELERLLPSLGRTFALEQTLKTWKAKDGSLFASYLEDIVNEAHNKRWTEVVNTLKLLTPLIDQNLRETLCFWDLKLLQQIIQIEAEKEAEKDGNILCLLDDTKEEKGKEEDEQDEEEAAMKEEEMMKEEKALNRIPREGGELGALKGLDIRGILFPQSETQVIKNRENERMAIFDLLNTGKEDSHKNEQISQQEEVKIISDENTFVVERNVFEKGNILGEAISIALNEDWQMEKIMEWKINREIGFDILAADEELGPNGWAS